MTQQLRIGHEKKKLFDEVCAHYGCTAEEVEEIKIAARSDPQAWHDCFWQLWEEMKSAKFMAGA